MEVLTYGPDLLYSCMVRANEMKVLNNSITQGKGNLVGFIGEEMFRTLKGGEYSAEDGSHFDYDIVMESGKKVDVKTKSCTSAPSGRYNASIAAYNTKQECDIYAFMRVEVDRETKIPTGRAWYMGATLKQHFFEDADFFRKGDVDPESDFGWRFRADCYNLKYDDLRSK